eukprot:6113800-Pyramimonas_sp.AAC.1
MPHFAASWCRRHEKVLQISCPPLPPEPAGAEGDVGTKCFQLGYCICSDDGKKVKQLHGRML